METNVDEPQVGDRASPPPTPIIETTSESTPPPTEATESEAVDQAVQSSAPPADPEARPKPILVRTNRPNPEWLKAKGLKIRDFAYESKLPPVKPVWRQQIQPTAQSSQSQDPPKYIVITRPKTPENYITTPTVTPNGSYVWATPEDAILAMSQQQPPPPPADPLPDPAFQSIRPLITRQSTQMIIHSPVATPTNRKRRLSHTPSSNSLRQVTPSKFRRYRSTDELPRYTLRSRAQGHSSPSSPVAGPSRVLRSHTEGQATAVTVQISCQQSPSRARVLSKKKTIKNFRVSPAKSRSRRF